MLDFLFWHVDGLFVLVSYEDHQFLWMFDFVILDLCK